MHVFINRYTVTGDIEEFRRLLGQLSAHMRAQPGFHSHQLYRSARDERTYVELAEWTDPDSHRQALAGEGFQGPVAELRKLATADPAPFELLSEYRAAR
ncbi:antibiotic biosynthesis monooxygenase [Streptomyces sp. NBC_00249]|uniref:antibiotic biosynthesis monooxygenase family protein n=1 Tax=Streptomyces sp. NBC_00249 TaxID=2975690 RepID=UPI00225426D4|nr:antibiotic biosynthesis monooxygenase family protein [Streptomyces sp. NBC_00249]MCX5199458.1 antibiotic biosynthesis monooxygenase [Streptomyces sp. NBC_00249]